MKFSIIIPSYNSADYIAETISSVVNQHGNFEIELIIIDNCSEDNTLSIISEYYNHIFNGEYQSCNGIEIKLVSEPDDGMYDAINKGFSLAKADIFAWINTDDIYLPGAFSIISQTFDRYSEIFWLKGITSYINKKSTIFKKGQCYLYDQDWIKKGIYGIDAFFIQQDSCFWRSVLWHKVGGINPALKLAGDYNLWILFAKQVPLYSINAYVSCFRKRNDQLSNNIKGYLEECETIISVPTRLGKKIKLYFQLENLIPLCLRPYTYRLFFGRKKMHFVEITEENRIMIKKGLYYLAT